ncbi:LapA family protein [Patescibacteria group bacterium]|nr:LapA family protein [Patescibacteria group bacterium]
MIIIILVVAIFIGLFLAGFMAPIFMVANKKKLKEMDRKIEEFENKHFSSAEEKERAKQLLKKELVKLKSKITADKKSTEEAADKISIL